MVNFQLTFIFFSPINTTQYRTAHKLFIKIEFNWPMILIFQNLNKIKFRLLRIDGSPSLSINRISLSLVLPVQYILMMFIHLWHSLIWCEPLDRQQQCCLSINCFLGSHDLVESSEYQQSWSVCLKGRKVFFCKNVTFKIFYLKIGS